MARAKWKSSGGDRGKPRGACSYCGRHHPKGKKKKETFKCISKTYRRENVQ